MLGAAPARRAHRGRRRRAARRGPCTRPDCRWSRTCRGRSPICGSTGTTTRSANCAGCGPCGQPQKQRLPASAGLDPTAPVLRRAGRPVSADARAVDPSACGRQGRRTASWRCPHDLHAHPEIAWEEARSAARVAGDARRRRVHGRAELLGLATAFRAHRRQRAAAPGPVRRVRRAARPRATPADTTSSPPSRPGPRAALAPVRRRSRHHAVGVRHPRRGRRRRQDRDARPRRVQPACTRP